MVSWILLCVVLVSVVVFRSLWSKGKGSKNSIKREHVVVLVDMDGVVADMDKALAEELKVPLAELSERKDFEIPARFEKSVKKIWERPGFFLWLPVMEGAKEGVAALQTAGFEVYFCTSPMSRNPTCASDKLAWVKKVFGESMMKRTIITDDKTLVRGAYLIDDRDPTTKGKFTPVWQHVVFDHPSNQHMNMNRKLRLYGWKQLTKLLLLMKKP